MKMKKSRSAFAAILCAAMLTTSVSALPASAASSTKGDASLDNTVNLTDIVTLQQYLLHKRSLSRDAFNNSDMNSDGRVNAIDLASLKRKVIPSNPVSDGITIHLKDTGIQVEGDTKGVTSVNGKTVTITASGTYTVDGTITDGQVLVNVPDTTADAEDVELVMNNVSMTSSTGTPCIYGVSAAKVKITNQGTTTFTDTASAVNAETSGVIYAECDITVTKSSAGTLNINSSMNTGIYSKDDIKLNGGTIVVNTDTEDTSDADGIKAKNSVVVGGAEVQITASADGIKSTKDDVTVESGTLTVKAGKDAVQAATDIVISGGTVTASGDRGFTLDEGGNLTITGGNVLATATDYAFASATAVNTAASTQGILNLSYAAQWTKNDAIAVLENGTAVFEGKAAKKYQFALVSCPAIKANGTYQLVQSGMYGMKHSTDTTGKFAMTGTLTSFLDVVELDSSTSTPGDAPSGTDDNVAVSLVYSDKSVTAYNAAGSVLSAPTNVTLSGTEATVISSAAEIEVSGSCSNGQLIVNIDKTAEPEAIAEISMNGLTLSNSSKAPVYVMSCGDEVRLSAKNGTTNTISDGTSHSDMDGTDTIDAAIYSKDDLKIKGKGTLVVNGNTADGIVSKDDLKIWNGDITVNSADDAIRGKDSVRIGDPDATDYSTLKLTLNAKGGDGIKSTEDTDTTKGYVTINGGTFNIKTSGSSNNSGSAKGIKSVTEMTINGGTFDVNTTDDSFHAGGNLTLVGGKFDVTTGDDAFHSDADLIIGQGSATTYDDVIVNVNAAYEGMEGANITQNSGSVYINSTDDGYNAAGGADGSGNTDPWAGGGFGGRPGQGGMGGDTGSHALNINGGMIYIVTASGDHDGIDSNGSITMTNGIVMTNGNEPFDADGTITTSGGTLVKMFPQGSMGGSGDVSLSNISANTVLTVTDASGKVLAAFPAGKTFTSISVVSSAGTATVYTGGTLSGSTQFPTYGKAPAVYAGGTISGGTSAGSSSGSTSGGQGGWGGRF